MKFTLLESSARKEPSWDDGKSEEIPFLGDLRGK